MKRKRFNHFDLTEANVNVRRSSFSRPCGVKGTMPTGKLIPLFVDEVLPGDTHSMTVSSVIRGATPLFPVMDNAFFDMAAFFIPHRLVMDEWQEFMGENNNDYWTNKTEVLVPRINVSEAETGDYFLHTPIDYINAIGQLAGVDGTGTVSSSETMTAERSFNALVMRSMCKTWNDWYRNQNVQEPAHIYTDSVDRHTTGVDSNDYVVGAEYGLTLLPVNKFKDYFTSALPQPQKHAPITLPMGDFAPLKTIDDDYNSLYPLFQLYSRNNDSMEVYKSYPILYRAGANEGNASRGRVISLGSNEYETLPNASDFYLPYVADLSDATAVTINQIRLAIQTQRFYEKQALYGSRYNEIIYSMFGVYSADARLQRAEFLGGKRIPIHQYQVNNTTSAGVTPLGDVAAFSLTNDKSALFTKSFTEHGFIMVFGYVRTYQTYGQGQEKYLSRRELLDYYFPVFAHIGEQPILNKELFFAGSDVDNEVFGYQEAFAEYRYKQSRVCGLMRPELSGSLSSWHYGNYFSNVPVLGDDFVRETELNVRRTQAVESETQWLFDLSFDYLSTRPMPVYSIPGLVDHF